MFTEVEVGQFFQARPGRPKFIQSYMENNPGPFPVFSAALSRAFGYVNEFDYEGTFLTWVMNGYGGRVQQVSGKFSANRDRGVFVPRGGAQIPDLTYLKFAMESPLMAAAVGRRVDGSLNEYTKIYPNTAESVGIRLPVTARGGFDFARMTAIGQRLRRIEAAQDQVRLAQEPLRRAAFAEELASPLKRVALSDSAVFALTIGDRVLKREHNQSGLPVYSANVLVPFGRVAVSNLSGFDRPSLLWGIDGNFDWNLIPAGQVFATTDHCGRLQILDDCISPEYVFAFLKTTKNAYGFDRVFRASLRNVGAEVTVAVPLDDRGVPSEARQRQFVERFKARVHAQEASLAALSDVLKARLTVEM
jgi:hypothetical protein